MQSGNDKLLPYSNLIQTPKTTVGTCVWVKWCCGAVSDISKEMSTFVGCAQHLGFKDLFSFYSRKWKVYWFFCCCLHRMQFGILSHPVFFHHIFDLLFHSKQKNRFKVRLDNNVNINALKCCRIRALELNFWLFLSPHEVALTKTETLQETLPIMCWFHHPKCGFSSALMSANSFCTWMQCFC